MRDTITVKVSDLYSFAKKMKDDGIDSVKVSILDEQDLDDDEIIPSCLNLIATSKDDTFMSTDYGYIESIE